MNDSFSRSLGEIADEAAHASTDLHVDLIVRRRRRRRAARRTLATGGAVAVLGLALLTGTALLDQDPAPVEPAVPTPSATPTADPAPDTATPDVDPSPEGTPAPPDTDTGAADEPHPGRPLLDPLAIRLQLITEETYAPDYPRSDVELEDGDYFGKVSAIDPDALTLDVDILRVYTRQETIERRLAAGFPREEADDDAMPFEMENAVERVRTVPVAADAVVVGWCSVQPPEIVDLRELSGPRTTTSCSVEEGQMYDGLEVSDITRDHHNFFWVDVRGGRVVQLVGQFMS